MSEIRGRQKRQVRLATVHVIHVNRRVPASKTRLGGVTRKRCEPARPPPPAIESGGRGNARRNADAGNEASPEVPPTHTPTGNLPRTKTKEIIAKAAEIPRLAHPRHCPSTGSPAPSVQSGCRGASSMQQRLQQSERQGPLSLRRFPPEWRICLPGKPARQQQRHKPVSGCGCSNTAGASSSLRAPAR